MTTTTSRFTSFSAAPSQDFAEDRKIQVGAWAPEPENEGLFAAHLLASDAAKFRALDTDGAAAYLVERGCPPMLAAIMVGVASHGHNRCTVWPEEGRVEVLGDRK